MTKLKNHASIESTDKYLDTISNIVTLILKSHLLVEEALFAAVQKKLPHPLYLQKANLRFPQLVSIAKGLLYVDEDEPFWSAISMLNTIRNRLAHRLDPSVSAEEMEKIAFSMSVPPDCSLDHPEAQKIINFGLGTILGFLIKYQK